MNFHKTTTRSTTFFSHLFFTSVSLLLLSIITFLFSLLYFYFLSLYSLWYKYFFSLPLALVNNKKRDHKYFTQSFLYENTVDFMLSFKYFSLGFLLCRRWACMSNASTHTHTHTKKTRVFIIFIVVIINDLCVCASERKNILHFWFLLFEHEKEEIFPCLELYAFEFSAIFCCCAP